MRSAAIEAEKTAFWPLTGRQKVYLKVKFVVDWLLALAALVVLSPVFGVIVLAIKREDGGPVSSGWPATPGKTGAGRARPGRAWPSASGVWRC